MRVCMYVSENAMCVHMYACSFMCIYMYMYKKNKKQLCLKDENVLSISANDDNGTPSLHSKKKQSKQTKSTLPPPPPREMQAKLSLSKTHSLSLSLALS